MGLKRKETICLLGKTFFYPKVKIGTSVGQIINEGQFLGSNY